MTRQTDMARYREWARPYLDDALRPAEVRPDPPPRFHPEVDDYTMSMGMAMTRGGRIWLGWFAGGDDERAVIVLARSDDGGETFSEPQFILDPGYSRCGVHLSAVVGNLWTAPDGRLFLFFMQSWGYYDGRGGVWQTVCDDPDADSPSWSAPARICDGAALNKPAVLADGTWLLPVALWSRRVVHTEADRGIAPQGEALGFYAELDAERGAQLWASRDRGATWARRGIAFDPDPIFQEPMAVERADGSLLMYMRTLGGMAECESRDGGFTWGEVRPCAFPSASARFFLSKLSSGNLLLVRYANPERPAARSHLTAFVSRDGGATWEGGLLLDVDEPVSYPDGFQAPDGRIFIQYDYRRECGEIRLAVFREEDALAGRDTGGVSMLGHPVVQGRTMSGSC